MTDSTLQQLVRELADRMRDLPLLELDRAVGAVRIYSRVRGESEAWGDHPGCADARS